MSTPVNLTGGARTYRAVIGTSTTGTAIASHLDTVNAIRVISMWVVATTAVTVKFQSSTGTVDLTGAAPIGANGGFVLPYNPGGWFQTAAGDDLLIVLGTAVAVAGSFTYIYVNPLNTV